MTGVDDDPFAALDALEQMVAGSPKAEALGAGPGACPQKTADAKSPANAHSELNGRGGGEELVAELSPGPALPELPIQPSSWDDDDDDPQLRELCSGPPASRAEGSSAAPSPISPASGIGGVLMELASDGGASPEASVPPPAAAVEKLGKLAGAIGGCSTKSDDELDDLVGELLAADDTAVSESHCMVPNFHCTGCDFQVMRINGFRWSGEVEYLFFRNNYPIIEGLRPQLVPDSASAAYCCQCSWKSVDGKTDLADVASGLKWRILKS